MSHAFATSQTRDALLAQVVDEYLAACRAGQRPDVDLLIAQHPEIAADLTACLASLDFLENIAQQERLLAPPAADEREAENESRPALRRVEGTLGDFRILGEIGRGGMGVVYEAQQISLNRRVALKVLPFAAILDDRAKKRFQNEALAAAQLDHPHIVDVYGVGCERGVHYYAMRLIEGRSLAEIIEHLREQLKANPKFDPSSLADLVSSAREAGSTTASSETLSLNPNLNSSSRAPLLRPKLGPAYYRAVATLGMHVAEALDHAHEQGVLHRDIKPSNLMLDSSGKAWITDFGLARLDSAASLTHTGDLLGTLRYMSPEQALGKRVAIDHRSDIYSLGATLYELVTFHPPYESDDYHEMIRKIGNMDPCAPHVVNEEVPVDLETIILKAMAKETSDRYETALDLVADLQRFLTHGPIRARRPGILATLAKRTQRYGLALMSLLAMALIVIAGLGSLLFRISTLHDKAVATAIREEKERDRASRNFQTAIRAIDDMVDLRADQTQLSTEAMQIRNVFQEKAVILCNSYLDQTAAIPEASRERASLNLILASIYQKQHRRRAATKAASNAAQILAPLHCDHPDIADITFDLARSERLLAINESRQPTRPRLTLAAALLRSLPVLYSNDDKCKEELLVCERYLAKAPGYQPPAFPETGWTEPETSQSDSEFEIEVAKRQWPEVEYVIFNGLTKRDQRPVELHRNLAYLDFKLPQIRSEIAERQAGEGGEATVLLNMAILHARLGLQRKQAFELVEAYGSVGRNRDRCLQVADAYLALACAFEETNQCHSAVAAAHLADSRLDLWDKNFSDNAWVVYEDYQNTMEWTKDRRVASALSHARLAKIWKRLDREEKAIAHWDKASIMVYPPDRIWTNWVWLQRNDALAREILCSSGKGQTLTPLAERIASCTTATAGFHADYWVTLGIARYRLKRWMESTESLERAMEIFDNEGFQGDDCELRVRLDGATYSVGDDYLSVSVIPFGCIVPKHERNIAGRFVLAMAYWQLNKRGQAAEQLEKAIEAAGKLPSMDGELMQLQDEARLLIGRTHATVPQYR